MFLLHKAFVMNASQFQVIVSKLYHYFSEKKFADASFGKYSMDICFDYDETVTILSRLIFAFPIFALHLPNMLMAQKE